MGYLHIDNLYKNQDILMFKECYALEKIHGTSAHILWSPDEKKIRFFSVGEKHENFTELFAEKELFRIFEEKLSAKTIFYGEAYGGKRKGMNYAYGKHLKFIVFDIRIGDYWLSVPQAERLAISCGLEFVAYNKITTDLEAIDAQRDLPSEQAKRNGTEEDQLREGVVLRSLIELSKNNNSRIIVKHKRAEFRETLSIRKVNKQDAAKLENAKAVAEEWVTPMRLNHVLDKLGNPCEMSDIPTIVKAMIEDVCREAEDLIIDNKVVRKAIGTRAVKLYKGSLTKIEKTK